MRIVEYMKTTILLTCALGLATPGCSLVTVPVKTVGKIVTTTVSTTGKVVSAPFDAVGRDKAAKKEKAAEEEQAAESAR